MLTYGERPYLFIIVAEAFSRGLNALLTNRFIVPYALPLHCIPITHLAFADDVVIFTRAIRPSLKNLMNFLHRSEACVAPC